MFLKRSLLLVPLVLCLSLMIGCSGDESAGPAGSNGADTNLGSAADNLPENAVTGAGILDTRFVGKDNKPAVDQATENGNQETKQPTGSSLDLSYVTDDFTSAVIVHPARVLKSDFVNELVKAGLPLDDLLEKLTKELSLDPRQVEQVVVLVDKETASMAPQMLPIPLGPPGGFGPGDAVPAEGLEVPENSNQGALDNPPAAVQPVAFLVQPAAAAVQVEGDVVEEGQPVPDMAGPPEPTVIVRLSTAMNPNDFFENFNGPPLEDAEVDGLKVKQLPFSDAVFYFADSKNLIYTQPRFLKKMVDTKSAESELITELKNIDPTHDLIAVADLTPFRQLLQMGGAVAAGRLPPDLAALANIPNKTKMLTLTAGINNASLLSLTFVMDTAEDAQATNTALTGGLKMVQAIYEQQKAQGLPPNAPLDEAGRQEVIAMADEIVAGLSNEAKGNRLTVSIPKPGNFNKLAALMGPILKEATKEAQKAAQGAQQRNQLKQIGLAFHNYYDTFKALPGAGSDASGEKKGLSWRVYLLPYLDEGALYQKFNLDEPWDSEHNKALISEMPDVFKTPEVKEEGKTVFQVVVGDETAFQMEKGRKFAEFTDGLSNTILVVQAGTEKAEAWTKPGGLEFDKLDFTLDNSPEIFGKQSFWFKVLMADGRVIDFREAVPTSEALKAWLTRRGGEPVDTGGF